MALLIRATQCLVTRDAVAQHELSNGVPEGPPGLLPTSPKDTRGRLTAIVAASNQSRKRKSWALRSSSAMGTRMGVTLMRPLGRGPYWRDPWADCYRAKLIQTDLLSR